MSLVRTLAIAAALIAGVLGRPTVAQSPPASATGRPILILVTKERLRISTDGNLPADASKKELESDGMLIRCNSCELDRQDGEKKVTAFRCQGDVLVEGHRFTIRAESVTCEGTRLVAAGTTDKSAEFWNTRDGDKKTSFSSGRRILFDTVKDTIEVEDGRVLVSGGSRN